MTGNGMLGWLTNTGRPDVAYAHSRQSQHMANPSESAWESLEQTVSYLKGNANLTISVELHGDYDCDIENILGEDGYNDWDAKLWNCYTDSDLAGNTEIQNKRRSQNGAIATHGGAPIMWSSKVTSVAFAHPKIGEAHPDTSSAAAEIYAASNATHDFMYLSYVIEEMGMDFPTPIMLGIDNTAAIAFANNSCFKSNLKHIDCRQEWVHMLRDKAIIKPFYVKTTENLADIFTKILPVRIFQYLRDKIMVKHNKLYLHDKIMK